MSITLQEQLTQVNEAIYNLVGGAKSWSVDGTSYTNNSIPELNSWRMQLLKEISQTPDESGRVARPFARTMIYSGGYS